ncbi:beta-hydroxyacid dehydrogenase, 3-hydroxyisobutyrate dehydrogenase [Cryptosporangium arvum DSM 44712]|uniref:Beta-hydroxyacid dehydrogenase, 3-hydroxyisobutyrate dehydrogenase n=1 Tax=Cryptosporangium arvum DSM 44712 TaxID=927661 RepID=A0A010ZW81_9ACTN|nr:beta-hydroxyacid dehydrogenase, 3-hydroxyisobutyrate dehydrogenase [Cryptosporangium arvum DSM 44712]
MGFVGLGSIGAPMARRLLRWPGGLVVHDVDPRACAAVKGAEVATGVAELASRVGFVSVMVRDDDQVRDVVGQIVASGARPLVAVHSTVAPPTPAALASAAGPRILDAPVSGSVIGADAGTLAFMVGGTAEDFAAAKDVLALMGTRIVHAGPVGAGTAMKLARNLLQFVSFTAAFEAQRLASAAGLDVRALGEVVRHTDAVTGGPGSVLLRGSSEPLTPDDPWTGVFTHVRTLGEKDLGFAVELAAQLDVDVPLARYALAHLGRALGLPEVAP